MHCWGRSSGTNRRFCQWHAFYSLGRTNKSYSRREVSMVSQITTRLMNVQRCSCTGFTIVTEEWSAPGWLPTENVMTGSSTDVKLMSIWRVHTSSEIVAGLPTTGWPTLLMRISIMLCLAITAATKSSTSADLVTSAVIISTTASGFSSSRRSLVLYATDRYKSHPKIFTSLRESRRAVAAPYCTLI